ncbi:MAG: hypothetical protein ACREOI_12755 [bacterium]
MMKKEVGSEGFAIWLLGDSNPKQWENALEVPFDPRHPIRHNIWTSVLEVIQDKMFRECRQRVDMSNLYIRNAIENAGHKPVGNSPLWREEIEQEIKRFGKQTREYHPPLLLCFGAFAFEFARRALDEEPKRNHRYWDTEKLGQEFRQRIERFEINAINALPLLHRSIAGGKFIESHNYFCGQEGANYFETVGNRIADILIRHRDKLQIWIGETRTR